MLAVFQPFVRLWQTSSLILQIFVGLLIGAVIGLIAPSSAVSLGLLGDLFVGGLKAVAPILVFILVCSAIANHQPGKKTSIRALLMLYGLGTVTAAVIALSASTLFPSELVLFVGDTSITPPSGIGGVLNTLIFNIVANPIDALLSANYIGILTWAVLLGLGLQKSSDTTKQSLSDLAEAITRVVRIVIAFAPIGILGLVAYSIATTGFEAMMNYAHLLAVLIGCMLVMALLVNPLIVFLVIGRNPYPMIFPTLLASGLPAFFTRSSAANIPVNMNLCKRYGLPEDTYAVSIPLGATVNMAGAAITITTLTLAATATLGIQVDFASALLLCVVAAVSACGASGVAGGSLLLIPLACSLFGIDNEISMQVVAIGFVISVLQDSLETALNSSTDVVYTTTACIMDDPSLYKNITEQ